MMKIKEFYKKYEEIINYLIIGGLTTFVNLAVKWGLLYTILDLQNGMHIQIAVIISWIVAFLFAYVTNRKIVFKSKSDKIIKEFIFFFGARVSTLLLEMLIMYIFVTLLKMNSNLWVFSWTIISQIVVIILNYVFSKLFVFNKKEKNNIKISFNNKIALLTQTIISIFLAFTAMFDKMLIFKIPNSVFGGIEEKNFEIWSNKYLIIFLSVFLLSMISIFIIEYIYKYVKQYIYYENKQNKINNKILFCLCFFIITLFWTPYILSFFPGGIYSDTKNSLNQAIGVEDFNNNNPIFYAIILRFFYRISMLFNGGKQLTVELFTMFQEFIMIFTFSYFIVWLNKKNISKIYLIMTLIFFSLFNLIPLYAVSIWKDTLFNISLFWYGILIADIVISKGIKLRENRFLIFYNIMTFFVIFTRNNGIIIALLTNIIVCLVYRKILIKEIKKYLISTWSIIAISLLIMGPIFKHYNIQTPYIEKIGIPIQQIAYVVATNGKLNDNQITFINKFSNIDSLKENYNSGLVDTIKWGKINNVFLEKNKKTFITNWVQIFIQNPKSYIKAYLLNTIGFWDVNKATFDGYTCQKMWGSDDEYFDVNQYDLIKKICGISIKEILTPKEPISSAFFMILMLIGIQLTIFEKNYKNLIIFTVPFGIWISIMLGVPLAFSLRYVYILVLYIPFNFVIPLLEKKDNEKTIENI